MKSRFPSCVPGMLGGAFLVAIAAWMANPIQALAAEHPLARSMVDYLPMPEDGEWDCLAVSPDGSRVYFGDAYSRVVVIDTATDTVADTIELADDDWIGGMAFSPDGRFFVGTGSHFVEIDPSSNQVVRTIEEGPYSWAEGSIVVAPDGLTAYVANWDEIYMVDLSNGEIALIDAKPEGEDDDEIDGLVAANPSWGPDFSRVRSIAVSPDANRLYVIRDTSGVADYSLLTIDGLAGGTVPAPLTLTYYEIPDPLDVGASPRMVLSADGTVLFDTFGNVWQTSDMQVVPTVFFEDFGSFGPYMLARSPGGEYLYYQGFASSYYPGGVRPDLCTYGGEQIQVVSGANYQAIDLDGDADNGLTGINLPEGGGWGGTGSYNNHDMVITPDGRKLYIAAGGSGALVVEFSSGFVGLIPNTGGDDGDVTVRAAFLLEARTNLALSRSGQADIVGTHATLLGDGTLQARFDLRGQPLGHYDVVFTAPGGDTWRIEEGFTIEEAREAAALNFLPIARLSLNRPGCVSVVCQNTGNNDLIDLVVTLRLPPGTPYMLDLPSRHFGGESQVDTDYTTASAEYPEYLWIGRLAPGERYRFRVTVAVPQGTDPSTWDAQLEATAGYVKASDEGAPKAAARYSAIGDLCTIADAVLKNLDRELDRRGHDVPPNETDDVMGQVISDTLADYGVAKLSGMIAKALGELALRAILPEAMPLWDIVFGTISDLKSCFDLLKRLFDFDLLFSWDPNDKISTSGLDGYILGSQTLDYVIHFENLPEATAPAHNVVITDELSKNLDLSTFSLDDGSHPDLLTAQLDESTGSLIFTFAGIELPPNVEPPEGEGWVEYSIRPEADLPSGTQIRNHASIVFDTNNPIVTPEVVHIIDTEPPSSAVAELPETIADTSFTVEWPGTDDGVGVWDYTVYVSIDDGPYLAWQTSTEETSATYTGVMGSEYRFYCVSRDRLGNVEPTPAQPDTTTTLTTGEVTPEPEPAPRGACGACCAGTIGTLPFAFLWLCWMKGRMTRNCHSLPRGVRSRRPGQGHRTSTGRTNR